MNEILYDFCRISRQECGRVLDTLDEAFYREAVDLVHHAQQRGGRLHITGIGKPAHVAAYVASLLSSTGTPAYFLHGTEAVHGSCGQLEENDVVICISNSGETEEMKATAQAIRSNGCKIIAVTGDSNSWLARFAEGHHIAHVSAEGGPLGRAPRASVLAEMLVLQGLSTVLQADRKLTPAEYIKRHPGGALGKLRENEVC